MSGPWPEARAQLAGASGPGPGDPGFDLDATRAAMAAAPPARLGVGDEVAHVVDVDAGGVRCRLYRPREGARVVVHVHGGGWVTGDLESHDAVCRLLAARSGLAVLAVDYRLSPEAVWPAAVDDVETAVGWLTDHADELGVRADRLAILGDSAGGTVAAAVALRARDRGSSPFALQALIYPVLDAAMGEKSYAGSSVAGHGLSAQGMAYYWDAYAPSESVDRSDPEVSPYAASELAGLPPTLVLTAENDPLRDEGETFATRLAEAGVPVVATRHLGVVHGFWRRPTQYAASVAAVDQVAAALARALIG